MIPVAMTIAGSDPSGGAGLQADLKTFHQHGVYGTGIVTLITVQNTREVAAVELLDAPLVAAQLDAVLKDLPVHAAKTGALGNAAIVAEIAQRAAQWSFPLVVDPVMISKHGKPLIDHGAIDVLKRELLPHVLLVTPNLQEAQVLSGIEVTDRSAMERAAAAIAGLGARSVLIKGGHLEGPPLDVLWSDGAVQVFPAERIETRNTHGTGCVYSAAIAARLARGEALVSAVRGAKDFITRAIATSPGLGHGCGPVNLHAPSDEHPPPHHVAGEG
jgi:hydroxymethylpyrimidine/phosphomethylpyrimidine kinase